MIRNESRNKTTALEYLLILAKNLLCEIETAINNTGMKMPTILTRDMMNNRLTFRNNNRDRKLSDFDEVDEIDSKFAKIRFNEYLHNLQQVLRNRMGKQHHHTLKKVRKNLLLRKGSMSIVKNDGSMPQAYKPFASAHNQSNDNDVDSSFTAATKKHSMHRNGMKHRNRTGLSKQRRNRKQPQKVAGLGLNDMKHFRNQMPRNHRKSTILSKMIESRTSTTTIAPHT